MELLKCWWLKTITADEDLYAIGRRQNPLWGHLDVQYWALSKRQYHGNYGSGLQARRAPASADNPLEKIVMPALILKADASPEVRKANEEAASVMKNGKLVHIDGAKHNLHHDKLERTTQVIKEFLSTLWSVYKKMKLYLECERNLGLYINFKKCFKRSQDLMVLNCTGGRFK